MLGLAATLGKPKEPGVGVTMGHSLRTPEGTPLGTPPRPHPGCGGAGVRSAMLASCGLPGAGMPRAGAQGEGRKQ